MPEDTIINDTENAFSWDSIARYYDTNGQLAAQITTFDNGLIREDFFLAGQLDRRIERDTGPDGGVRIWDELSTYYDPNGDLVARLTTYDNGNQREEIYSGGVRERTRDIDLDDGNGGNNAWSAIDTYYDTNGVIAARLTEYDSGLNREETYVDGQRDRIVDTDLDDGNGGVRNWQDITTYYDANGAVAARLTNYDNGGIREELFVDGTRDRTLQIDGFDPASGDFAWDRIETYYDLSGNTVARLTTFDDGTEREEIYQSGALVETREYDPSPDGTAAPWTEIRTFYQDGVRTLRDTQFDDGVQRVEEFQDGIRSRTVDYDGSFDGSARSYQQSTTYFDPEGKLSLREVLYDNAVMRIEEFDQGQRVRTVETDVENTVSWQSREAIYDPSGALSERVEIQDSGVTSTTNFDNGLRIQRVDLDLADSFNWSFRGTTFDESGVRDRTYTALDNNDELYDIFVAGQRTARMEIDGDESDTWIARVTEYDAEGAVATRTTYDTLEELPPEYAGELGLAMAGF